MNPFFVLIAVATVWLMTFVLGVMLAAQVRSFAAAASVQINRGAVVVADRFHATAEIFFCLVWPAIVTAAGRMLTAVQASIDSVIELFTSELPETSFYHLAVNSDSAQYSAGEYLIRDNSAWRNVYLTAHARALMGDSADVIALSPASVHDANGAARVWHIAIA